MVNKTGTEEYVNAFLSPFYMSCGNLIVCDE